MIICLHYFILLFLFCCFRFSSAVLISGCIGGERVRIRFALEPFPLPLPPIRILERALDGAGHGIWRIVYASNRVWRWLFAQTRDQ